MNNNDNIEQNFKNAFDPKSISNQGWNDPSDSLWSRIDTELSQKESSRFGYGYFLLATGILLSLLCISYLVYQNNVLQTQLHEVKEELENYDDSSNDILKTQNISNYNLPLQGNLEPSVASKIDGISTTNQKKTTATQNNILRSKTSNLANQNSQEISKKIIENKKINTSQLSNFYHLATEKFSQAETIKQGEFSKNAILQKEKDRVIIINRLETPLILPLLKRKKEIITTYQNAKSNIEDPIKSIVTVSGGIVSNNLLTNGRQITPATEFIDQEYANLGAVLEIKYSKPLSNNWSLGTGIAISQQSYVTEYNISLPYDLSKELVQDGAGRIDFEHSLPTSFGNTDTELTLLRSNTNQPLDENIVDLDFDTKHQFISLQAPISLDYLLQDVSRGFFAGIDVIPSYILSARSGISSVVSHHSEIQSINNASTSEYASLQRLNLALGAHIGYRLPISKISGIELGGRYTRNMNSYFEDNGFTSNSHGLQFSAGYYFKF